MGMFRKRKTLKLKAKNKKRSINTRLRVTEKSDDSWWLLTWSTPDCVKKIRLSRPSGWSKWKQFMLSLKNQGPFNRTTMEVVTASYKISSLNFKKSQSPTPNSKLNKKCSPLENQPTIFSKRKSAIFEGARKRKQCLCQEPFVRKMSEAWARKTWELSII